MKMINIYKKQNSRKYRFVSTSVFLIILLSLLGAPVGPQAIAALILASALFAVCLRLLAINRSPFGIGPDWIVLGLLGTGSLLSTLYLVVIARMSSLGYLPIIADDVPSFSLRALAMFWATILAFSLGYHNFTRRAPFSFDTRPPYALANKWPRGLWGFTIVTLTIVGLVATLIFVSSNGGIIEILSAWNDRDSVEAGIPRLLMYATAAASLLWLAGNPTRLWPVFVHLGISFLFLSLTGSRNEGVRLGAAALVIALNNARWRESILRRKWILGLLGGIAFMLFFVVGGVMRSAAQYSTPLTSGYFAEITSAIFRIDILEQFLYAYLPSVQLMAQSLWVSPAIIPYQQGATFVSALDVWIPGPFTFGDTYIKIGKEVYWAVLNVTGDSAFFITYPGELYINWGIAGVLIGSVFLGVVCRWVFKTWHRFRGNPWADTLYAVFVGSFLPFLLMVEAVSASFYSFMYFYLLLPSFGLLVINYIMQRNVFRTYHLPSAPSSVRSE